MSLTRFISRFAPSIRTMINFTPLSTECISLLTTESEATSSTTTTSTVSSSSTSEIASTSTTTASLTDNLCSIDNSIDRVLSINSPTVDSCLQIDDDNCNIMETLTTATTITTTTSSTQTSTNINNLNISIDSDSNDSLAIAIPNPSTNRDISCIDLTEADEDEIEIIKEKLTVRPTKKRKREKSSSTSTTTTTSCCSQRPCRSSLRESSTSHVRSVSLSPRSAHHRTSFHHHHPLTPPLPPLIPLQEPLRISPPRSDSFIVDLANSPSPSTSSSSNKNSAVDKLVESVPKRRSTVEQPQEPVRYKIVRCPICLEEDHKILAAGGEIVVTICGHVYCKSCLYQAVKTNHCCPNCRRKLTQRNYHRIFL